MHAVVVYESMFGNTHTVAEAIGAGIGTVMEVDVLSVHEATADRLDGAVLLVVGGPTHVHSLSRASTRATAVADADDPEKHLSLDPDAHGDGLREWFDGIDRLGGAAAAFDTRVDMPPALSGRASKAIAKRLRKDGCTLVAEPESFLVDRDSHLEPNEVARATAWGVTLAAAVT
ncbi:MAG: flavodoxin domain-containing protein [Acidimicrobiia bacterium]